MQPMAKVWEKKAKKSVIEAKRAAEEQEIVCVPYPRMTRGIIHMHTPIVCVSEVH